MGREDGNAAVSVFQSRLRAKKEERMQRKQQEQDPSHSLHIHALVHGNSQRRIVADSEEAVKRRERAEARKRVIEYHGSVWDAVTSNDLDMVRNYFLVEGAQNLLRRRHPDAEQGGRTLLHCAAWLGYMDIIKIVLTAGCDVDVVDSVLYCSRCRTFVRTLSSALLMTGC
ncbi:hypothetical protein PHMEG_00011089 [Phytophthora megakarya]|uniref:Uncharacterized protein n=1 Tax=Phytophthora megakarya TaxID=4795 RepID=A0A225WDI3_9STRA|nr:hypothetical protein PHMEG_00011089 [Phytophthora megakarya]